MISLGRIGPNRHLADSQLVSWAFLDESHQVLARGYVVVEDADGSGTYMAATSTERVPVLRDGVAVYCLYQWPSGCELERRNPNTLGCLLAVHPSRLMVGETVSAAWTTFAMKFPGMVPA